MPTSILSLVAVLSCISPFLTPPDSYAQQMKQFYELRKDLSYSSMLLHEDMLWVGTEGFDSLFPEGHHEILVFDTTTFDEPTYVRIPHAPQFIYAYGPGKVLAVGMSAHGFPVRFRSHFSVITYNEKSDYYDVKTTDLPEGDAFPNGIVVNHFAEVNSRKFFSLLNGENSVMEWKDDGKHKLLPVRIIKPDIILNVDDALFVLETDNTDNLFRIDLKSKKSTQLFADRKHNDTIADVIYWKHANLVAAAERSGLIVVDPKKNRLVKRMTIDGNTNSLALMGTCLIASSFENKMVHIITKTSDGEITKVGSLDLNELGASFNRIRRMAYDENNKQLLVRATDSCPECATSRNGLAKIWDLPQEIIDACKL